MPGLKDIRNRIKAVKSTQQITRAMKMVASAKFKRAEQQTVKYRTFKRKIEEIANELLKNFKLATTVEEIRKSWF